MLPSSHLLEALETPNIKMAMASPCLSGEVIRGVRWMGAPIPTYLYTMGTRTLGVHPIEPRKKTPLLLSIILVG